MMEMMDAEKNAKARRRGHSKLVVRQGKIVREAWVPSVMDVEHGFNQFLADAVTHAVKVALQTTKDYQRALVVSEETVVRRDEEIAWLKAGLARKYICPACGESTIAGGPPGHEDDSVAQARREQLLEDQQAAAIVRDQAVAEAVAKERDEVLQDENYDHMRRYGQG